MNYIDPVRRAEEAKQLREMYPVKKITDVEWGDCFVGHKKNEFSIRKIVGLATGDDDVQYMSYGRHDGESHGIGVCSLYHLVQTWASRMATPEEIARLHLSAIELDRQREAAAEIKFMTDMRRTNRALQKENEALKQEIEALRAALREQKRKPKDDKQQGTTDRRGVQRKGTGPDTRRSQATRGTGAATERGTGSRRPRQGVTAGAKADRNRKAK